MKFNQTLKNKIKKEDFNYCYNNWQKFIALNEQEKNNLDKINEYISSLIKLKKIKDGRLKAIHNITKNVFYTSRSECANKLGVTVGWITRCINEGWKAKGCKLAEVYYGR